MDCKSTAKGCPFKWNLAKKMFKQWCFQVGVFDLQVACLCFTSLLSKCGAILGTVLKLNIFILVVNRIGIVVHKLDSKQKLTSKYLIKISTIRLGECFQYAQTRPTSEKIFENYGSINSTRAVFCSAEVREVWGPQHGWWARRWVDWGSLSSFVAHKARCLADCNAGSVSNLKRPCCKL